MMSQTPHIDVDEAKSMAVKAAQHLIARLGPAYGKAIPMDWSTDDRLNILLFQKSAAGFFSYLIKDDGFSAQHKHEVMMGVIEMFGAGLFHTYVRAARRGASENYALTLFSDTLPKAIVEKTDETVIIMQSVLTHDVSIELDSDRGRQSGQADQEGGASPFKTKARAEKEADPRAKLRAKRI